MEDNGIVHVYQEESDWCGIACWNMIFKTLGSYIGQSELIKYISDEKWGTSHEDHMRIAESYFTDYQAKEGWSIEELLLKLNDGHLIICDIWDDYETYDKEPADGHYIVIKNIDDINKKVTVLDPSQSKRINGRQRVYQMNYDEFNDHWYDFLDEGRTKKTEHWAICVNPESLKR